MAFRIINVTYLEFVLFAEFEVYVKLIQNEEEQERKFSKMLLKVD